MTIQELKNSPSLVDQPVSSITLEIEAVKSAPQQKATKKGKPFVTWTARGKDSTGHISIKFLLWQTELKDAPRITPGDLVTLTSVTGSRGIEGVKLIKGDFEGKPYYQLEVTSKRSIQIGGVVSNPVTATLHTPSGGVTPITGNANDLQDIKKMCAQILAAVCGMNPKVEHVEPEEDFPVDQPF